MDGSARPDAALLPLTEAQEGLWFAQALDPQNPILNTGQYLDLQGPIDLPALRQAVDRALAEAGALRLRLKDTPDGPRQWLDPAPLTHRLVDLSDDPDALDTALAAMAADTNRSLDLARDPLAAVTLFVLGPKRCLIYERIHHLAIDGYGMVLVTNRMGENYTALTTEAALPQPLPGVERLFQDDAAWRASDRRKQSRDWWHTRLADLPEVTGPAQGRAVTGQSFIRESRWLPGDLLNRLAAFAETHDLSWPDVLTGLTGAYLSRWTGGDIVVGLPFMARMGRPIARVPGMVMNVLPQRMTPDEDAPLAEWLRVLGAEMRDARRFGHYRSEYLRRELGRIGGDRRLFGPLINVQPFDRPPIFAGLKVALNILGAGAVDDLTLTFRGDPDAGLLFEVDANPALYSHADVAGHADRLPAFLNAALGAGTLAAVPTASPDEIAAVDRLHASVRRQFPDDTLVSLITAQIAATPDAIAIEADGAQLTFADLDRRSRALAAQLRARGAGPGAIVAVMLNRGMDLPVALLGILRAGAAYLPLDPDHPADRIARILSLSAPVAVLTSADLEGLFPAGTDLLMPDNWAQKGGDVPPPAPDDAAYVIYTSGSTGEPKGVVVEHRAIVNRLLWMADAYGIRPDDRILQKTPATFDVSVWEFFLPMLTGATLVMAPPGAHRDPSRIAALIRDAGITTLHFVPSMLSAFLAAPASDGLRLRRVFCSGEELTADQRDRFHARITSELHNLYGPTEAAVDVSHWAATSDDTSDPVPIGWPVWNTQLLILDERGRPQPPGLAGRLYLGGVQLARGYLGRDDLTAARFVPDARNPDALLYDTGDLARRRHDGAVEFLGRLDHQVKIRGLRIELGEIEAAIMATGLAREAVVIAREDHAGEKRLVAYLVTSDSYAPGKLAVALGRSLPSYMVPGAEVVLDAMPLTANGKLDRKALPAPQFHAVGTAPETATELLLSRLYGDILHLPQPVPTDADFFALGGDSLSAVRLALALEQETGRDPGLGTLFETPTLGALASRLDAGAASDDGLGRTILLADGDADAVPLFLIHPAGGLAWGYRHLARRLAPKRRIWGLQHPGLDPDAEMPSTLQALAADYASIIAGLVPDGPVHLAGWSVGGILAQGIAVELTAMGREVGMVAAMDAYPADMWRDEASPDPAAALRALLAIAGFDPDRHLDLDSRDKVVAFLKDSDTALGSLPERVLDGVVRLVTDTNRLVRGHHHQIMAGQLTHIRAGLDHADRDLTAALWAPYVSVVDALTVPFLHADMTSAQASAIIAPMLDARMG
ncbi:MAG: non-ribosomal peptide synthetase [Paracoccus denitrificans]|nr:MAG: non-ribosomal peptide synthetase [Paracoccus denitrificans]PZO83884.1 MAG: non-ribosomal peptide synthetase [Paracoccus denitrificans]